MRKIDIIFISSALFAAIAVTGAHLLDPKNTISPANSITYEFPETKYGAFLAAQHAVYVNDFDAAARFVNHLGYVDYPIVQNTKYLAEFLGGKMPDNAKLLKNEKSMPAQMIYDAYLVQNDSWKELHNRHKSDESAIIAPLRIWSAIANNWRTNTFKFIDDLPTNQSWKSFIRGQIYAELGDTKQAAEHFEKVSTDFMNLNDYLYLMSFFTHHDMIDKADKLHQDFTSKPGGMFLAGYDKIPDWSVYSGLKNALAFSLVQNVSHTQIMMYSDLSLLMLRFAESIAPDFANNNNTVDYYLGQFFYNNTGKYEPLFKKINPESPFFLFANLRLAQKSGDIKSLEKALKKYPLFVPAINQLIAHHIKNGNKRAALRVINQALDDENLNDAGRAFFTKSRAQVYFVFGDLDDAQKDIRNASDILMVDAEIVSLQAKIWAKQNREIEAAYEYAMTLVRQNPSDVLAWDTLGYVVATREGADAAIEILERVGEISDTCSSLFEQLGDLYAERGDVIKARKAYMRAIDLSDDGLTVVPVVERKIRKLK